MREQRWPWLLTAGLMLPRRCSCLVDVPLLVAVLGEHVGRHPHQPTVGDGPSYEEFAKLDPAVKARMFACERRMDGDEAPWTFELNIAATALAGVAWLALVLGMRWQLRTKAVAALPGLAPCRRRSPGDLRGRSRRLRAPCCCC